ncbi:HAUS augmin-like complex subunit 6 isoform X2 [Rhinoraja longicauda]
MYAFAKYVLTQKLKKQIEKSDSCHKIVRGRSQDLHLAVMKCCIARNQFLEGIQKEAFVVQEYKRRETLLVNENQALKKQHKEMKDLLEKSANGFVKEHYPEMKELRKMWNIVMDALLELEKEKEIIDSIMEGRVDLDILDGTDVAVKVPRPLVNKIENEVAQIDDLYIAGKLNPAAIIQLCNWSLRLLDDQRNQVGSAELEHNFSLENLAKLLKNELIEMKEKSQKITEEVLPSIQQSISEMESAWDMKWEQYSNRTGFSQMIKKYPVLDLLPTMPTLSFEPASEEAYKSSIFYSHSATFSGPNEQCTKGSGRDDNEISSISITSSDPNTSEHQCSESFIPSIRNSNGQLSSSCLGDESIEVPLVTKQPHESRLQTPCVDEMETWQMHKEQSPLLLSKPKEGYSKGNEPHQKTFDQLAEEVADNITKDSVGEFQNQDLVEEGDHFSWANNPFIVQSELRRTPENLITDIRNTWRCAVQESELEQMKQQEPASTQSNYATDQFLLKPEKSPHAAYMKVPGSFCEKAPPDTSVLQCAEIDQVETWSKTLFSPDIKSASSNCLSIRNEKWNNCREPEMHCSDVGSEDEGCYFNGKARSNEADGVLSSKILSPPSGSQENCSSEDDGKKNSVSLINNVMDDELNHSLQFLPLEKLNPTSPIKKEKLSKSFILDMCKNNYTLENSRLYTSFDGECNSDSTLPWNQSQNVFTTPDDSLKPPRYGILHETIPDVLGNDSLNSTRSPIVGQLDEPLLNIIDWKNRLEELRKRSMAVFTCGVSEKKILAENMGHSHFQKYTDSKDQSKLELTFTIDHMDDEVVNTDKLFTQESTSLKALSSLETQPGLNSISLSSSSVNVLELQDDFFGISLLSSTKSEVPQMAYLAKSEASSLSIDTCMDNGEGQLITF